MTKVIGVGLAISLLLVMLPPLPASVNGHSALPAQIVSLG